MQRSRYRAPFWRRHEPLPEHDITKLRSHNLEKGKRFETVHDAHVESERSELLLKQARGLGKTLAEGLENCREGQQQCDQTFCPLCARVFRRWFIGELLRLTTIEAEPVTAFTVLLKKSQQDGIEELDPDDYRGMLRQRLIRAGLGDAVVIGGFENVYRARQKEWVLHINLVVVGGLKAAMEKLQDSFGQSDIDRPIMKVALNDPAEQLSYVLKFTTYHRPYEQRGTSKGPARPLNAPEHLALVQWMSRRAFKDFLFLFNAHQGVDSIVPHKRGS
jgi:hypothetical protein